MKALEWETNLDLKITQNVLRQLLETHCENSTDRYVVNNVIGAIEELLLHTRDEETCAKYPVE